jgi:ADP-dependent NAD(P)H-hydrate dehydratase
MTVHKLTETYLRSHRLPDHAGSTGKQSRGQVLIIGGSRRVPGAALLAGLSALRAGAGILQIATAQSVAVPIALAMPEVMVVGCDETPDGEIAASAADRIAELAENCDSVLIGPGMLDPAAAGALTKRLLQSGSQPMVLDDAAAFTSLQQHNVDFERQAGRLIVTPHAGEIAKFLGRGREQVEADMLGAGRQAAAITRGIVAMKGPETHVVAPNGGAWLSRHGSIALATSGSGDTLAGLLAGLLARGSDPLLAMLWAVYVHGEAGNRLEAIHGKFGALARELPVHFSAILNEMNGHKR